MRIITTVQFNGTTEELQARVSAFLQALEDHRLTVGVPAPREEDFVEELARSGEAFQVVAPEEAAAPTPEDLAAAELEAKRTAALRELDEKRLAEALVDPDCPQSVKDYDAAVKAR